MRHSVGRMAGVSRPRPHRHICNVALVVTTIHAALITWAWHRTAPPEARSAPARVALQLVMPHRAAPTPAPPLAPAPARQPAALRKRGRPSHHLPPVSMQMPMQMQTVHAQAAHEAIRAQLTAALQHEMGRWQVRVEVGEPVTRRTVERVSRPSEHRDGHLQAKIGKVPASAPAATPRAERLSPVGHSSTRPQAAAKACIAPHD